MNYTLLIENIKNQMIEYITKNKLKSLVIGISGGIDSAVVAVLARIVCHKLGIKLIGISIPIETNSEEEIKRAKMVGEAYCHEFTTSDLTDIYKLLRDRLFLSIAPEPKGKDRRVACGNIKARMRMIVNYFNSGIKNGMVLSTDNLTECLLGFWTLHGDVGDYGPIQNLWKTEVYELALRLINILIVLKFDSKPLFECINGMPTDGLGISNSDLDQIMPDWKDRHNNHISAYEEVDKILKTWCCEDADSFAWDEYLVYENRVDNYHDFKKYRETLTNHPVVLRHISSEFKRRVPINIRRMELIKDMDEYNI